MQITKKDLTPDQLKIYASLCNAKQRCTNPNHPYYYCYGGRGIQYRLEDTKRRIEVVLEQEQAWQKCKRKYPKEQTTINRIDNNGHYEEGNIEWITMSENIALMNINSKSRPVKCLTSGEVYPSVREAGRLLKINIGNISSCCLGNLKSAGKYKGKPRIWQYVEILP